MKKMASSDLISLLKSFFYLGVLYYFIFNKRIIVIPNAVRNLQKILRHYVPQNDKAGLFDNLLFYDEIVLYKFEGLPFQFTKNLLKIPHCVRNDILHFIIVRIFFSYIELTLKSFILSNAFNMGGIITACTTLMIRTCHILSPTLVR